MKYIYFKLKIVILLPLLYKQISINLYIYIFILLHFSVHFQNAILLFTSVIRCKK